jgi:DNA polymerase-1
MVVGEAPGYRKDDINKPFSGEAGKLLDNILIQNNYPREKLYITNAVRCRPPDNRTPGKKEIMACQWWMKKELEKVKPKFLLLLGLPAAKTVIGDYKLKLKEYRGRLIEHDNYIVMITFHPGAAIRDDSKIDIIDKDVQRFLEAVKLGKIPEEKGLNFEIVNSLSKVDRYLDDLEREKYISLDVETLSLSPWENNTDITLMGLGLKEKQWVIPLNYKDSIFKSLKSREMIINLTYDIIKKKTIIGQNGKFDSLWPLVKYGIDIKMAHDTMILSYLLDENSSHKLKYLASTIFGAENYDLPAKEKTGGTTLRKLAKYNALDAYYTRKLYFRFIKEIREDYQLYNFYRWVMMPATRVFRDIENNGVYINTTKLDEVEGYLKNKISGLEKELSKYKKEVNWNSPQQVAEFLFEDLDLNPLQLTKSGKLSTAESVMKKLSKSHEAPAKILEYREAFKMLSSFVDSWKEKIVDNRLHPFFKLHGTVTGRLSCKKPNLQQVPRDPKIRTLVSAPPGWSFVEADFSQIELRIAAMLSGDEAMKLAFQTGEDIHIKTAQMVSGRDMSKLEGFEAKEWRKKAKAVNFGFLYGMGSAKFQDYALDKYGIELTYNEAKNYRKRFFDTYNSLPKWHKKQIRVARMNGYVRCLSGRIRHLPDIYSDNENIRSSAERQAINSPVQGFASDLTLMSLVEIHQSFSPDVLRLCGSVHDSILMEIKNEYLDEIIPEIKSIMEHPNLLKKLGIRLNVPIVADITIGDWGSSAM